MKNRKLTYAAHELVNTGLNPGDRGYLTKARVERVYDAILESMHQEILSNGKLLFRGMFTISVVKNGRKSSYDVNREEKCEPMQRYTKRLRIRASQAMLKSIEEAL